MRDLLVKILDRVTMPLGQFRQEIVARSLLNIVVSRNPDNNYNNVELSVPNFQKSDISDLTLFERIFSAYRKAKAAQKHIDKVFQPASMWEKQLNIAYTPLLNSLSSGNLDEFSYFLTNFGRWESYTGIETTTLLNLAQKSSVVAAEVSSYIGKNLFIWDKAEANGRNLSHLSYPRYGNQAGFMIDDVFVGLGSVFNNFYGDFIARLLTKNENNILEVGGGYGKLFTFIEKNLENKKSLQYIDLDIPEVLCCASYYLMKSFPNRRFALFGEHSNISEAISEADFILYPNWSIRELPDQCADIFINKNSLGEMEPEVAQLYIEEATKRVNQVWFLNHEFERNQFENGHYSLINSEFNIPENFTLSSRIPDPAYITHQGITGDIYQYHYVRKLD